MKRFVKHFYSFYGELPVEDKINDYAEKYNLKIIMITPAYGDGIYVLFEESENKGKCTNTNLRMRKL